MLQFVAIYKRQSALLQCAAHHVSALRTRQMLVTNQCRKLGGSYVFWLHFNARSQDSVQMK